MTQSSLVDETTPMSLSPRKVYGGVPLFALVSNDLGPATCTLPGILFTEACLKQKQPSTTSMSGGNGVSMYPLLLLHAAGEKTGRRVCHTFEHAGTTMERSYPVRRKA